MRFSASFSWPCEKTMGVNYQNIHDWCCFFLQTCLHPECSSNSTSDPWAITVIWVPYEQLFKTPTPSHWWWMQNDCNRSPEFIHVTYKLMCYGNGPLWTHYVLKLIKFEGFMLNVLSSLMQNDLLLLGKNVIMFKY